MNLGETMLVKPFANRRENDSPHLQNRAHLIAPNEQVPLVQEKLGTVELFGDRKLLESRMDDSPLIHLDLSPTWRSGIGFHLPMYLDTRLYPSGLKLLEGLLVNRPLSQRTL